ncbi:MAG: transposase [Desulfovibrio sp.]|nr:transposase [Desulfovibrio sp.]
MPITNGKDWRPAFRRTQRSRGQARPVLNDPREILNAVLWMLRTGAPRKDLQERCPPCQTCHRRFQRWRDGKAYLVPRWLP